MNIRIVISLCVLCAILLPMQRASAQVLFTTTNDFNWTANGSATFNATPSTTMDSDGSAVNGLGNLIASVEAGLGGALSLQWVSGTYDFAAFSPGEQSNSDFLAALEMTGKLLTFDYTTPTNNGGSYFLLGIAINCQGRFDQIFPTSTASLGGGWTRATIDWSSEAALIATQQVNNGGGFTYFQMGIIWNSDYNPPTPLYVDNIVLRTPPPAPVKLYTTMSDFANWTTETGFSNVGPTNFDLDGDVTNGLGNTFAAGALDTGGSLNITWTNGTYGVASYGPSEQNNAAFLTEVLQPATVTFDYVTPPAGTGTYFEVGLVVDCQGRFDQLFPSTTAMVSNGITRAFINWTSEAQALVAQQATNGGSFDQFRIGILWNSNYTPPTNQPFQVDNIAVVPLPTGPSLTNAGSTLISESCLLTNGAINPGETVTLDLSLENAGGVDVPNVVASLQPTGGVTLPSGAQSYGTLLAGGPAVSRPFTFTASGACGDTITASLQVQTNSVSMGSVPFVFTLGALGPAVTNNYSSGGVAIPIPYDSGSITSSITVNDTGVLAHISVRVRIDQSYDGDLNIDLIHPDGTDVSLVLNDPFNNGQNFGSGATNCTGTFTVFDDSSPTSFASIAETGAPYDGTYSPEQPLSVLNGKSIQGTWNLIVTDPNAGDIGTLYCWQLQIAAQPYECCSTPVNPYATWENHYFTMAELANPAFSGPNADPLGKGINNTNQFLAGFNPTNSAAYPHIILITRTNANKDIRVDYLGASGDNTYTGGPTSRTNVLEFTAGKASGGYSNNFVSTGVTNILSGGTGLGTITNLVEPGGGTNRPSRYYRVRVLVP
jgi:subtilisin-like proprotein convertase family protein